MIPKPTGEDSNERNNNLFAPYPNISSRNLLIGDETSNQETDDIRAFLRSEEVKGRLTAVSTASSSINRLNFNLHKESSKYKLNFKGKTKKNKIRAISFEFTLIRKRSISSIPKRGNELWEQLMTQNLLLQKITFNNDGENYVNNQVVATFPCLIETGWQCFKAKNTSDLEEMPFKPESIKDLNYIKRASTSKSKVYIKPVIDNLCELSESSNNSSDNFSTISLTEEEIIEPPNGSLQDLMKHFKYKLQDQYYTDNNITIIFINENTIIESLIEWAKNADDKDLLQRPSIDLALEE
ncbi:hypothetical protein RhiirA5_438330 [Rhizophagus irregularis]|uniref:Uncharacterized protein n=1 Tax=Rhizophagus irregularis TaxID=588596 RepID=A0A2N0NJA5_9GLOM|nr:hypothetical protein RhiirA5_438330 [Rhizophagus irregularis]